MEPGSPTDSAGDDDVKSVVPIKAEEPQRGWISPDDRLWRHPSERATTSVSKSTSTSSVVGIPTRPRHSALRSGLVAIAVVAVATTASVALANATGSGGSALSAAARTSVATMPATVPMGQSLRQMMTGMLPSMVAVVVHRSGSVVVLTGVAMQQGNLVVTSADGVADATGLESVTPAGRHQSAELVGVDYHSGIALVRVAASLPAAPVADAQVAVGQLAVSVNLRGVGASLEQTRRSPAASASVGTVREAGEAPPNSEPALVDAIEADVPMVLDQGGWGGVLLNEGGAVMGILDRQEVSGGQPLGVFIPSALALGVAQQLAGSGHVEHGWLGIAGSDSPDKSGVKVLNVFPGMPAYSAGITAGDVLKDVDDKPIGTIADLQARLYVLTPGNTVTLDVEHAGHDSPITTVLTDKAA